MALRDSFASAAPIADSVILPISSGVGAADGGGFEALLCGGRGRSGAIAHVRRLAFSGLR